MGKRAQRIPSWPGVIHSNKGRILLRRPTCDILTFRLRRSGGPYIPVGRPLARNTSDATQAGFWPLKRSSGLNAYHKSRFQGSTEMPSTTGVTGGSTGLGELIFLRLVWEPNFLRPVNV